jgi:hypothetical protein
MVKKLANVFDRRIVQKIVPRSMIVLSENVPKNLFQIGKINDHAAFDLSFDRKIYFIGMSVEHPAFRVTWQEMGAVRVSAHTKLHGVRIAQGTEEGPGAAVVSETAATAEV